MIRSFHLWRLFLHIGQGNERMIWDLLAHDPDEFSMTDALILLAWIEGARNATKPDGGTESGA